MKNQKFSVKNRLRSFKFAINGFKILVKEEHNSRIHVCAMILAIVLGFLFNIESMEWLGIILSAGLVIALELINSSIENLSDFVAKEESHDLIKKAKDLSAAAVLFASLSALLVGLIIFIPKLIENLT